MEKLTRKVLNVDTMKIESSENYAKKMLVYVEDIIAAYDKLGSLPKFTQKVWEETLATDGENVRDAYTAQALEDLKKIKNPALKNTLMQKVDEALAPFIEAVRAAREQEKRNNRMLMTSIATYLTDIVVTDGKPAVDISRITESCTIRIENEQEAAIYEAGIKAEKAMNALNDILANTTGDPYRIGWGVNGHIGVFETNTATAKLTFQLNLIKSKGLPDKLIRVADNS